MPLYAAAFMIFNLASVGLPGTSGFVGEFLVLVGAFQSNTWVAVFATSGIVLSAVYMLYLYRRVIFGELTRVDLKGILDLKPREIAVFAPMIVVVFWMGLWPKPILDVMAPSVDSLVARYQAARAAGAAPRVPRQPTMLADRRDGAVQ
jgi:NADH-quinone oxidoreductase subunit M